MSITNYHTVQRTSTVKTLSTVLVLPSYVVDRNFVTKLYDISVLCLQIFIINTAIIIIIMNIKHLVPVRPVSLDLEYAVGLSIFVLVSPDHDVNLDDTGQPIVRYFHSCHVSQFLLVLPISQFLKKVSSQNCKLFQIRQCHVTENIIKAICVQLQSCRCAMLQTVCYYRHKLKPIIH